jgi:hypothetical protein
MTQDQTLMVAFRVVLIAGVVSVTLWAAVYTYLAKWWANPIGRTVVDFAIRVSIAMIPSILSLFFQFSRLTSQVAGWIDVALFGLVALGILRRIPLWVKLHMDKDGRRPYAGILPFLAEVWRRHGRPVWKDWQDPAAEENASPPENRAT